MEKITILATDNNKPTVIASVIDGHRGPVLTISPVGNIFGSTYTCGREAIIGLRQMLNEYFSVNKENVLSRRISELEKEVAELKVRISTQPEVTMEFKGLTSEEIEKITPKVSQELRQLLDQ